MGPGFARVLLALQLLPFGAAFLHDWRRGALARFLPNVPPVLLRRLVQVVLLTLLLIFGASVFGYAGVARMLSALVVTAPGFALVFAALARVLDQAFAGLLATPLARSFRSVRERGDAILHALHLVVVVFCWATGVLAFTLAHSALDDLLRAGNFVANASVSAGELTITFSAILSAVLVVGVTWLVTKVVRFLLDYEILPRLNLRTGVPVAISTIVGYVLVVTGFVLATAALGIDLTKVTLLAGALGIGVGLGLQSVVNNFASGLILMLERPINVGDQIDVGGVLGEVKRIGVRSSTIQTFQGAEVIVPNSDLATKQVTNWTLSDRARRYEIDVGVAYGTDPAQVLRLLEGAVADLPGIQKIPPPRALFTGFGDSSLDFRLFAWVESVDIGLQAQNSMRMAILRALDAAGIAMPFPQRDLHIRYAPPGFGSASVPKSDS
jgi:small-conductance mechanosensitive channel